MSVGRIKYNVLVSLICILGITAGLVPSTHVQADGLITVSIGAPSNVPVGGEFVARINIAQGVDINSYQIQLSYDPGVIQVKGVENDSVGVTSGLMGATVMPVEMWSFFPVGRPDRTVRILGRLPANMAVSGSGYLAEVHFVVLGDLGDTSSISPIDTQYFLNSIYDTRGNKIATSIPWASASVTVYSPLIINTTSFPAGSVENSYSDNLSASGGYSPYHWAASGLPSGITLLNNAALSGIPTQSGDFNVSLSVTDSGSPPSTTYYNFVLQVFPALQILSSGLPDGMRGLAYTADLTASAAASPLNWVVSGLPPGLSSSAAGRITGAPSAAGDYTVAVNLTDSFSPSHHVNRDFMVHIYDTLTINTTSLPLGLTNHAYSFDLSAGGGKAPYVWSAAGLPDGLTISAAGTISGTPLASGDYTLNIGIRDSTVPANTANRQLSLHVNPFLQITTLSLPEAEVSKNYSASLSADGGIPPYSWKAGGLPAGLSCSSSGIISGVPLVSGNVSVGVTVTDSRVPAYSSSFTYNLHTNTALLITTSRIPAGLIGKAYSLNLTAVGSHSPYSWTVNGLPPGLSCSASGLISGTATSAGNFILNIRVTGAVVPTYPAEMAMTLKIYLVGDANGDGIVTMGDVVWVERVILGLCKETPGCDANLNGAITMGDVTRIERIILGY